MQKKVGEICGCEQKEQDRQLQGFPEKLRITTNNKVCKLQFAFPAYSKAFSKTNHALPQLVLPLIRSISLSTPKVFFCSSTVARLT
jgi:hypothetical protein